MNVAGKHKITQRTAISAGILVGSRLATRMIDFVTLLVLARILTPVDFGIVAIALTLVQMLETVFDVPIAQVFIRSEVVEPGMLDTAFSLALLRSITLMLVLAALAVPFSIIYADGRLIALIVFLSLAPAFRGMISPAMAMFARELDFRRDVVIEILGKTVGIVGAIGGALVLHSYWAIAFGTVLTPATMAVASYVVAPYRPKISLAYWKLYSGFLGWFTVSQLIAATNWKLGRLVLGAYVSKGVLGSFSMAGDLCAIPEQALIRPTIRPLASGFAKLQQDVERLGRAYLRSATTILASGLSPLLGMAMLARPAIRLAMGPKWQSTAPIITWLALLASLALITACFNPLCIALGQTRRIFTTSLADLCVRLPATLALTIAYGMPGTIVAQFLATGVYMLAINISVVQMTRISIIRQWALHWRTGAAGAIMVEMLWWLCPITENQNGFALFSSLAVIALAAEAVYLATLMVLWQVAGCPEGLEKIIDATIRHLRARFIRLRKKSPTGQ